MDPSAESAAQAKKLAACIAHANAEGRWPTRTLIVCRNGCRCRMGRGASSAGIPSGGRKVRVLWRLVGSVADVIWHDLMDRHCLMGWDAYSLRSPGAVPDSAAPPRSSPSPRMPQSSSTITPLRPRVLHMDCATAVLRSLGMERLLPPGSQLGSSLDKRRAGRRLEQNDTHRLAAEDASRLVCSRHSSRIRCNQYHL